MNRSENDWAEELEEIEEEEKGGEEEEDERKREEKRTRRKMKIKRSEVRREINGREK